jgi:hypothetical protein
VFRPEKVPRYPHGREQGYPLTKGDDRWATQTGEPEPEPEPEAPSLIADQAVEGTSNQDHHNLSQVAVLEAIQHSNL